VTMVWVVSRFRFKVETSFTRNQKSINNDLTHERYLLAGGDLTTLGSLQVKLPKQPANQLIEYLSTLIADKGLKNKKIKKTVPKYLY